MTGYTIGKTFWSSDEKSSYAPVAVMAQASVTNIRNNNMRRIKTTVDTVTPHAASEQPRVFGVGACSSRRSSTITWACLNQRTYDNLADYRRRHTRRSQQHR